MMPLVHVSENHFKLRKKDRVIGCYLYDKFDEAIARIDAVLADSKTYHCYYLIINLGGFLQVQGKTVILPVEICTVIDLGKVSTEWRKESMAEAPTVTHILNMTTVEEELIRDYYGLPSARPALSGHLKK